MPKIWNYWYSEKQNFGNNKIPEIAEICKEENSIIDRIL